MLRPVSVTIELLPAALDEAEEAAAYYRKRDPRVGAAFAAELDRVVGLIAEAPDRWHSYLHGTRRVLMKKFPFSVVFRQAGDLVLVVAIAHFKRKPGYWRRRRRPT